MIEQKTKNDCYCIRCRKEFPRSEITDRSFQCSKCNEELASFSGKRNRDLETKKIKISNVELDFIRYDDEWVFPLITTYSTGLGSPIAMLLYTEINGTLEYYSDVTVNIPGVNRHPYSQFIDINNNDTDILNWLELHDFGERTTYKVQSGFCMSPEFNFYNGKKFWEYKYKCQMLGY